MPNWGAGAQGAVGGAAAGASLGPWGAAAGGALGFLGGLFSGDAAEKNPYHQNLAVYGQGNYTPSIYSSQKNIAANNAQQQDFINAIRAQSLGQGAPSPAALMLQQAQQQQAQQAQSLIAGQRGLNPALAARMALDQQAAAGQQSAAQGAILRAQEQQAAQGRLGAALGQQGQQQLGLLGTAGGLENAQNANTIANTLGAGQINAGVSAGNTAAANAATGGLLNGLGGVGAHLGPQVAGGEVNPFGANKNANFEGGYGFAHGGEVPQDSARNDIVPSMLSPGEIVIPRSIAQGPDAAQRAADFVAAIKAHEARSMPQHGPLGMAEGGIVPDESWTPPPRNAWAPSFNGEPPIMLQPPPSVTGFVADPFSRLPGTMGQPQALPLPDPNDPSLPTAEPMPFTPSNPFATLGVQPPPGWTAPSPDMPAPVAEAPPVAAPKPAAKATPALAKAAPTASGLPLDLTQGQAQEQRWAREGAAVQADRMEHEAALQQAQAAQLQEMAAQQQATLADRQKNADEMFSKYASGQVDPNRYWSNMSTGGKISSAIGMMIGGIGAGLSHAPNLAAGVIENAINRDIDAQKMDLAKQANALSHYLAQTGDIRIAQQLAKADARDVVAAQLSAIALRSGGQAAQAATEQQVGAMRQKSALDRMTVGEMQFRQQQERAAVASAEATQRMLMTGGLTQEALNQPGMEKLRERSVVLPTGKVALAPSDAEAAKFRETVAAVEQGKTLLREYGALLAKHPHGILDAPLIGDKADFARADTLKSQLVQMLAKATSAGALGDRERESFEKQVGDITKWTSGPDGGKARISQLAAQLDAAILAGMKARGIR